MVRINCVDQGVFQRLVTVATEQSRLRRQATSCRWPRSSRIGWLTVIGAPFTIGAERKVRAFLLSTCFFQIYIPLKRSYSVTQEELRTTRGVQRGCDVRGQ
jgi:hypothetical protein